MTALPMEIAPGIYCLEVGKGIMRANVYFVRSGADWVLIDAGSANCDGVIQEAAEFLLGATTHPAAILLTHSHADHAGSVLPLARRWSCWVYVHRDELPLVTMDASVYLATVEKYANPLDRWIILPILRVLPEKRRESMLSASSFKEVVRALEPDGSVPHLPGWRCIPTPGHTPGHVSYLRPADKVLITGDAVVTARLNSFRGFALWAIGRNKQTLGGPPWYTTWNWHEAQHSCALLAGLEPRVLAPGHGLPVSGSVGAAELRALAEHFQ